MGLAISLRTKEDGNYYRQALLGLIEIDNIDAVLLSYPYFQEFKPYKNQYKTGVSNYSIIDDGLINIFTKKRIKKFVLGTITSSKNGNEWLTSNKNFVDRINAEILKMKSTTKVKYKQFVTKKNDRLWHAKIAIGFSHLEPVVFIIGSSNMTRPAFQEKNKDFNYECDVIMWTDEKYKKIFMNSFNNIDPVGEGLNIPPIFAAFDSTVEQFNEKEIMEKFYSSFKNSDLINFN